MKSADGGTGIRLQSYRVPSLFNASLSRESITMKKILGLLAAAGLMFVATPQQQANAMSLASPAGAASAQHAAEGMTTDVHWRHRGWGYHRHYRRHYRRHWRRW